jgi:predicted transcriptional regulator
MEKRITVRLDSDLDENLELLHRWTKTDKAKLVRMILKDFFDKNEEQLDEYYAKTQTE